MSVSVVIPAYNGEQFIQESLESVFAQTVLPQEIIVVDDASTDGTADLLESIAKGAPLSVRLIRLDKNSGGPARPMNVGVEAAAADRIALLDQDDVMLPCKISVLDDLLTKHENAALAFGQYHKLVAGRTVPHPECYEHLPTGPCCIRAEAALGLLLRHPDGYSYGGAGGTMIRRSWWRALGGFDESFKIVWDNDFALRAAAAGGDVAYAACPVYLHRRHSTNLGDTDCGMLLRWERCAMFRRVSRLRCLPRDSRKAASRAMAEESLEYAYRLRKARRYGRALAFALLSIRHGGNITRSLMESGKIAAQMAVDTRRAIN